MNSLLGFFSQHPLVFSLIVSALIIASAIAINWLLHIFLSQWEKRIRSEERHGDVSPARTRLEIVHRTVSVFIYFSAAVFVLAQFPPLQATGSAILLSAGVIGIVVGLAAQNTLSNFVAGIAIAFSQPVRLNDAVLYQGDWGWIEEITLMHTVIRTWDNRRLIIPNNVMNSTVIQNWTIGNAWLLGAVTMFVDYTCDVAQVRSWVKEIVNASPYSTEEHLAVVEVVDFTEKSMVLRILCKSPDSPSAWKLRCEIREKMIARFREAKLPLPYLRVNERER